LHWNGTRNPNVLWIVQQMGEVGPYTLAAQVPALQPRSKFGKEVVSFAKGVGSEPVRNAFRSPSQNGVAERWVGSCRPDLLDHVIVLN
jgi:hypothetical protein